MYEEMCKKTRSYVDVQGHAGVLHHRHIIAVVAVQLLARRLGYPCALPAPCIPPLTPLFPLSLTYHHCSCDLPAPHTHPCARTSLWRIVLLLLLLFVLLLLMLLLLFLC